MLKIIVILLHSIFLINGFNLCGDWTQYKDIKCFKVLEEEVTEKEALSKCQELDQESTLITINDRDEQEFIYNLLLKYSNTSMFAWIGMRHNGIEFEWVDGTDSNYTNWSVHAVRDGEYPCVEMSLLSEVFGQWFGISCERRALIVCQKRPEFDLNILKNIVNNLSDIIQNQQDDIEKQSLKIEGLEDRLENTSSQQKIDFEIRAQHVMNETQELKNQINSLIPLGFLYTQLPIQLSPQQLWPNMKWTEVTEIYAGLFFRAEGKGSEKFGYYQKANQSYISDIKIQSVRYTNWGVKVTRFNSEASIDKQGGNWTVLEPDHLFDEIRFYMTAGEVRPKNTAIRIWKRM